MLIPRKRILGISLMIGFAVSLASCKTRRFNADTVADTRSVHLPQCKLKDQGFSNFCWAYTVLAMLEAEYKLKTGREVNFSPEALGFMNVALRVQDAVNHVLTKALPPDELYYINFEIAAFRTGPDRIPGAFELVAQYGVVLEEQYKDQFPSLTRNPYAVTEYEPESDEGSAFSVAETLIKRGQAARKTSVTLEEVKQELVVQKVFLKVPPAGTKEYIEQFDPNDYESVEARSESEVHQLIERTKAALASGQSVPLAITIDQERPIRDNTFTAEDPPGQEYICGGGHGMLITDFVNKGGRLGALPPDELTRELVRKPQDLEYLYVKNSGGGSLRALGEIIPAGYYKVEAGYLYDVAKDQYGLLQVLVKKGTGKSAAKSIETCSPMRASKPSIAVWSGNSEQSRVMGYVGRGEASALIRLHAATRSNEGKKRFYVKVDGPSTYNNQGVWVDRADLECVP